MVSGMRGWYGWRALLRTSIRADPDRLVDLNRGEPGAVGIAHRLDEIIDERLDRGSRELFAECLVTSAFAAADVVSMGRL